MKKIALKTWQIHVAGGLACLMLTVGAYTVIGRPVIERHAELNSIRDQWDQYRKRSAQLEAMRRGLLNELRVAYEELDASQVQLQSPERLNTRIAQITDLASQCRLVLHETSSSPPRSSQLYDTITINLAGSGTFPDTARFLHELKSRMPDTGVLAVRLTGNPRTPETPAQYELNLVWYTAPLVVSAGE